MDQPRINISKTTRDQIWKHYMGYIQYGYCVCCNKEVINIYNFHVGHIEAYSSTRDNNTQNLRPIC